MNIGTLIVIGFLMIIIIVVVIYLLPLLLPKILQAKKQWQDLKNQSNQIPELNKEVNKDATTNTRKQRKRQSFK